GALHPQRRMSAPRQGGFTLIELVVVLCILGLMLTLVVDYKPSRSRTLLLAAATAEIASGLRAARAEAIARNHPVSFAVDLAEHRFRIGSGSVQTLSGELQLTLLTVAGEQRTGGIRFNPDGSSTGGRIELADGKQTMAVGVDWLTGRISVAELR